MNHRNPSEQVTTESCSQTDGAETEASALQSADGACEDTVLSHEQLNERYVKVLNDLARDAATRHAVDVFIDAVAWKMASVALACGPRATGEIVRVIGAWLERLAHIEEAQREAAAAVEAGHAPN